MELSVQIEQVAGNGYRATAVPPEFTAEGPTREEAMSRLRRRVEEEFKGEISIKERPPTNEKEHPLKRFAGMWKDHPEFEEYLEAIREYRRQVNADPNR